MPSVTSPCVRNCCLDSEDICLGCGRHLTEITGWQAASDEQRQKIVQRARERLSARQNLRPYLNNKQVPE